MLKKEGKRFLYRAHAVAVAGSLTKPHSEFLESQASSGLPITGGMATSRIENFRHRDVVSFRMAHSHAVGTPSHEDGVHTTLVTTTIEGLNVLNMVTADRVVARLASRHFMDGREASILTVGSHIENLKVAGHKVELEHDGRLLSEWDTHSKALEGCRKHKLPAKLGDLIHASVLSNISSPPGLTAEGHRLDFPEFGSIYIGEIFISGGHRRLTMLRIALGCSYEGDVTIGDVDGNGTPIMP